MTGGTATFTEDQQATSSDWFRDRTRHHVEAGEPHSRVPWLVAADALEADVRPAPERAGRQTHDPTPAPTGGLVDVPGIAQAIAQLPDRHLRPLADAIAPLLAPPTPGDYMTPRQAADLMACTRQHVYDLVREGQLPRAAGPGRRVLIRRADVTRYLEGR